MPSKIDFVLFDKVVNHARMYFTFEYHGGSREMVYRYICKKIGDVDYSLVSKALRYMAKNGEIVFEKKIWWRIAIK